MPYKDPERKRQWERLHRSGRLARRRELRQAEAAREPPSPTRPGFKPARVVCCFLLSPEARSPSTIPNSLSGPVASRWELPLSIRRIGAGGLWG